MPGGQFLPPRPQPWHPHRVPHARRLAPAGLRATPEPTVVDKATQPPPLPRNESRRAEAEGAEEPLSAKVVGNRVRILSGGSEVVQVQVVLRTAPTGRVTRRDLVAAALGAGAMGLAQGLPVAPPIPFGQPLTGTVEVPIRNDILPPASSFLASLKPTPVRSPHSPEFIVYLTGFLINFDTEWGAWWQYQTRRLPFAFAPIYKSDPEKRATYVKEQFGDMAAALREVVNQVPAKDLCTLLIAKYEANPTARYQLAVLFSLLAREEQPQDAIARILVQELAAQGVQLNSTSLLAKLGTEKKVTAAERTIIRLPDKFTPPALLPPRSFPVYELSGDVETGRWRVPAYDSALDADSTKYKSFGARNLGQEDAKESTIDFGFNSETIILLATAGGIATAITNAVLHPLENLKVRRQATMRSRRKPGAQGPEVQAVDLQALFTGVVAAFFGAGVYGLTIYPSFEVGKLWLLGQVPIQDAIALRLFFVITSSVVATTVACFVATPFESAKIRSIADPTYATNAFTVITRIVREEGLDKLYAGYPPYAFRNIFFTIAKFLVFDYFWEVLTYLWPTIPFAETALIVSLTKGAVAGALGVIISQPLDVILTKMTKGKDKISITEAFRQVASDQGLVGFFAGTGLRALAAATIVSLQFSLYDSIKLQLFQEILKGVQ